jgi:hypothetical protein
MDRWQWEERAVENEKVRVESPLPDDELQGTSLIVRTAARGRLLASFSPQERHGLAALALSRLEKEGKPVGFTWDDVDIILHASAAIVDAANAGGLDEFKYLPMNHDVHFFRLAERIAALLPPRPEPPLHVDYALNERYAGYPVTQSGEPIPLGRERRTREYVRGCLLGGAVGDALGAPVEFRSLAQIRAHMGAPASRSSMRRMVA